MGRIVRIGRAMPPVITGDVEWFDATTTLSDGRTAGAAAPTREEALERLRAKVAYLETPDPEPEIVEVEW